MSNRMMPQPNYNIQYNNNNNNVISRMNQNNQQPPPPPPPSFNQHQQQSTNINQNIQPLPTQQQQMNNNNNGNMNFIGGGGVVGTNNNMINNNNNMVAAVPSVVPANEAELQIFNLITMVVENRDRQAALAELSKLRDQFPDLAVLLWHSVGFVAVLLQEIISAYPLLLPPVVMTSNYSNRVCNSLTLLQGIATHAQTRRPFLQSHLHSFLYPFLNTTSSDKPYEFLRLTSLGVIGALVKADEIEVIQFLLSTDIVPLCLRIMERSTELSRTVATFIMQKILATEIGLNYVCMTPERFVAVAQSLKSEVVDGCSARLLRHIVRCYLCLTEHTQACKALRTCLPEKLKDGTFKTLLEGDQNTKKWLVQLLQALGDEAAAAALEAPGGGVPIMNNNNNGNNVRMQ